LKVARTWATPSASTTFLTRFPRAGLPFATVSSLRSVYRTKADAAIIGHGLTR
jgi:hypothetical protein